MNEEFTEPAKILFSFSTGKNSEEDSSGDVGNKKRQTNKDIFVDVDGVSDEDLRTTSKDDLLRVLQEKKSRSEFCSKKSKGKTQNTKNKGNSR